MSWETTYTQWLNEPTLDAALKAELVSLEGQN
jgi:hypothetical protein